MATSTAYTTTMQRSQTAPAPSYNTTLSRIRKSCLKSPSPKMSRANSRDNSGSPTSLPTLATINASTGDTADDNQLLKKCVSFDETECTVFTADDWDRTPTEPARKLSYQDLLELKEIQKSLPRAAQPWDPANRRSRHILSSVPIELLPLLPSNLSGHGSSTPPQNTTPNSSPMSSASNSGTSSPVPQEEQNVTTYTAPSSLFPHGIRIQRTRPQGSPPPHPPPAPHHQYHQGHQHQHQHHGPQTPIAQNVIVAASPRNNSASNNINSNVVAQNVIDPTPSSTSPPSSSTGAAVPASSGSGSSASAAHLSHPLHPHIQPLSLAPVSIPPPSFSNPASPQSRLGPYPAPKPVPARRKPVFNFVPLLDSSEPTESENLLSPSGSSTPSAEELASALTPLVGSHSLTPPALPIEQSSPSSSLSTPTPTEPVALPLLSDAKQVEISHAELTDDSDMEDLNLTSHDRSPSPCSDISHSSSQYHSTPHHHHHHGDSNPLVDPPTPSLTNASLDSSPSPSPNFDLELELDELDLNLASSSATPKIHEWDAHSHSYSHPHHVHHTSHYGRYGRGQYGYGGHGHGHGYGYGHYHGGVPEEGLSALGMDIMQHAGPVDVGKELLDADAWREEMKADKARKELLSAGRQGKLEPDPTPVPEQGKVIRKKKKQVIVINDMEIELDDDEDDEEEGLGGAGGASELTPTPTPSPPPIASAA